MEQVLIAAPVSVFSGFMIDLANFSASPAEAFASCQGATLAVVKDGSPFRSAQAESHGHSGVPFKVTRIQGSDLGGFSFKVRVNGGVLILTPL